VFLPIFNGYYKGRVGTFWQTKVHTIKRLLRYLNKCSFKNLYRNARLTGRNAPHNLALSLGRDTAGLGQVTKARDARAEFCPRFATRLVPQS